MEKLKMHSPDFVEKNIQKIAEFFPNCVTEANNEDGKLRKSIDFDLLRQELSTAVVEGDRERYHLNWPGKRQSLLAANAPTDKTLRPCRSESKNFDATENLFIEGDNLDALKLLQETYLGKVKMIYIDPPYNTGKDFIYKDKFTVESGQWKMDSGDYDEAGNRLVTNLDSNGRFHSDWLSMMYPRLKLARNLLKDDGVIFISIDDHEVPNLRRICDEIFGEENFLANVVWQKKYAATNDAKGFSNLHDHIIVYQKSAEFERLLLPRTIEQDKPYQNDDRDGKGLWRSDNLLVRSFSESGVFPIVNPSTGKEFLPPKGSCWRASKNTMKIWLAENRVFFGKDGKGAPQLKRYLSEVQQGRVPNTWWTFQEVGHNDAANKELKALFSAKALFDTPKPTTLIKRMLMISVRKDDLILDFFAGSATTAHATMQINAEDGGKRKFIMVQLSEVCDEKSEAFKAGYETIAEIAKERIRRAGEKINDGLRETKDESQPTLLEDPNNSPNSLPLDTGFRVLKVDSLNTTDVYCTPDAVEQEQLNLQIDNIKDDRNSEDLLFHVLLDWGVDLSLPIVRQKWIMDDRKLVTKDGDGYPLSTLNSPSEFEVFFVDGNALAACFAKDSQITEDFCKALAECKPLRVVFRDCGFEDDSVKINVEQIFKLISPHTEVKTV